MGDTRSEHEATGFSVIIIGAGIAGLATATGLAQKGHQVTILESHPALNEFGASIEITGNSGRVLEAFGLTNQFKSRVTESQFLDVRDGLNNESIGRLAQNFKNYSEIAYGRPVWHIHRVDYQIILADAAKAHGVKIIFDAHTKSVDVDACCVTLEDGQEFSADVIVGADGLRSVTRHSIPATADVEPKALFEQCFRCTVPKKSMVGNPKLEWLLNDPSEMTWTVPGRYVLSWRLPDDRPYDVVCCVARESDVPPGKWGTRADPDLMRKDFEAFCPEVQELLKHVDGCVKWTLADLPPLKTCHSENGRVVLVGDAFHGMIPHSASGGNSAVEDAGVLSECLDWAYRNGRSITQATAAFEKLRKDRVERMQQASHEGYGFLGADEELRTMRDQHLKAQTEAQAVKLARSEEERRADVKTEPDMHARFPSEPYLQWLHGYDAIAATKKYLTSLTRAGHR